jgi:tetratricopeptide (TPR) repeat protein
MTALAAPQAPTQAPNRAPRARRRLRPAAILAASLVVVAGSYALSIGLGPRASHAVAPALQPLPPAGPVAQQPIQAAGGPIAGSSDSVAKIDHAITAWTANLARNSKDFLSATYLGLLYEARGRLTANLDDYLRAESAATQALVALPGDLDAEILHARLLQTLHDFPGALNEARAILQRDPTALQALATAGDAELELGDVSAAAAAFVSLETAAPGAPVTARLSRLAFIQGDTATAITLAKRAYDEATAAGQTGASLGWYAYVAGTVALATGSPADAAAWFDKAVAAWPNSFLVLGGQARAQAALGDVDAAIATYQKAIAIAPQPDTLTLLGDLYALRGDTKLADQQYATVEAIAHLAAVNQQVYNRQLVLFSVNHDRDVAQALALATQELAVRKDAYGYDAYAWALLANGRTADADAAIRQALAFGTNDALLDYHAGAIAAALGDTSRARTLLAAALALPGGLDPLAASRAAATLAALP